MKQEKPSKEINIEKVVSLMKELGVNGVLIAEDPTNFVFGIRRVNFSHLATIGAAEFLKESTLDELTGKKVNFKKK